LKKQVILKLTTDTAAFPEELSGEIYFRKNSERWRKDFKIIVKQKKKSINQISANWVIREQRRYERRQKQGRSNTQSVGQCCGLWNFGTDLHPGLWPMDPDPAPNPVIFVLDLQYANKKLFVS
jgi:hypothetical protein